MEKTELKKNILSTIRQEKKVIYEEIKKDAEAKLASANNQDELGLQNQLESKREEFMEEYEREAKQVDLLRDELELLDEIYPTKLYDTVAFGAVVMTNQRNFFVSVTHTTFKANDHEYLGISTQAPIYQKMHGLSKGQAFTLNNLTYEIVDVF